MFLHRYKGYITPARDVSHLLDIYYDEFILYSTTTVLVVLIKHFTHKCSLYQTSLTSGSYSAKWKIIIINFVHLGNFVHFGNLAYL